MSTTHSTSFPIFPLNDVNSASDTAKAVLLNGCSDMLADSRLAVGFSKDGNMISLGGAIGDVLDAACALNEAGCLDRPIRRKTNARLAVA